MTYIYFCPKCEGELQESEIGVGGDQTIPVVECNKCDFYTDVDTFIQYIDYYDEKL